MVLTDVEESLAAFCKKLADDLVLDGFPEFQVVDFDTYPTDPELPAGNLIGPAQTQIELDGHFVNIEGLIQIIVDNDPGAKLLKHATSLLLERLRPTMNFDLYNMETRTVAGYFVVRNGTQVLPMLPGVRASRCIAFMACTSQTV